MIGLWHRWFDSREHRKARERAEGNYSRSQVRIASTNRQLRDVGEQLAEVTRERDALAEAQDGHNALLHEQLTNALKGRAEALDTVAALRRQVEDLTRTRDPATVQKIADQYAQVSKLPPALSRDRQALSRLEGELAEARALIEECRRKHR